MELYVSKRNEQELQLKTRSYSESDIATIRQLKGRRWIPEQAVWVIPYTQELIEQLIAKFARDVLRIDNKLLEEDERFRQSIAASSELSTGHDREAELQNISWQQQLRRELQLRNYSSKTIKAYCGQVERFVSYSINHVSMSNDELVSNYTLSLLDRKCSSSYINQAISAVTFYYRNVVRISQPASYVRPKKEKKLPDVLTLNDILKLFKAVPNVKHKAILYLAYSSGLRFSAKSCV